MIPIFDVSKIINAALSFPTSQYIIAKVSEKMKSIHQLKNEAQQNNKLEK